MRVVLLLVSCSVSFGCLSQRSFEGKNVTSQNNNSIFSEHYKQWNIYEISAKEIFSKLKKTEGESNFQLNLEEEFSDWCHGSTYGTSINFQNLSGNATSYNWDFGDGSSSTESAPMYTYSSDGEYSVTLMANNNCDSAISSQAITLNTLPTANFGSNITSGCVPTEIQFTDQSSSNTTEWEWTFSGGTPATSIDQNPIVFYLNSGNYPVTLVAKNEVGSDTMTIENYVSIEANPTPNFSYETNGPVVTFENSSSHANTYFWDFGDGGTSTEPNPIYQYGLNGDYVVTLFANNGCGTNTTTQVVSITSSVIANFSSNVISGCQPLTVQFNNQSTNANSVEWNFVGGNPSTSTEENPIVTYPNAGVFTVMLTGINATGSSLIIETGYIVVEGSPFASFTTEVNDLTVDFLNFSNLSDSQIWDFGDGSFSNELNPQHTYANIGVYPVTLTINNECGTNSFTFDVDVGTAVTADFASNNQEGCSPLTVEFSDESSGVISEWNWNFEGGNPSTSTQQNPIVEYTMPGIYEVTLEVTNPFNSNTTTKTEYVTILATPAASFNSSVNIDEVNLVNTSVNATNYFWTFGDGTTSTEENPQHNYAQDGIYTITLDASNSCGTVSTQQSITIVTPVVSDFSADMTTGCAGTIVQFSDASSDNVSSWSWIFEGGTPSTSTAQNPVVSYDTPGTYSVSLESSNSEYSASQMQTDYIIIADVPNAGFTANSVGESIEFNNTSTNATSYTWGFGDGNSSNEENPIYTYAEEGQYMVTLVATNTCGSSTTQFLVTSILLPTAGFSIDNFTGCAPASIPFLDASSSNTTSWNWTFEGGSPGTASVQNPIIDFNNSGNYTITLVASNAAGSDTFTMEMNLNGLPESGFEVATDILTTTFLNTSTNAISFVWDFGDGNTSTEQNPIHEYAEAGTYTAILIASNECGEATFSQTVEVLGPLAIAGFSSSSIDGCTPFEVNFTDNSVGNPTTWEWSFPGGAPSTSTEQNPTIIYDNAGTYDVSLMVTNPAGSNSMIENNYITVAENPNADFTASIDLNGNVSFTNNSTVSESYEWSFGDGSISEEASPVYSYEVSGSYTVQLISTNACGSDTTTQEIMVIVTSMDDLVFLEKLELFPNPSNGQFTLIIEGQPLEDLEIGLYNILGQKVMEEPLDFTSGKIIRHYQLDNLPAASYILQIRSEHQLVYRKLIKE